MMKKLWRWEVDCGRMGSLEGLFIEDEEELKALQGKEIYLGEVLGKHRDITYTFNMYECTEVGCTVEELEVLVKILGGGTLSGINPLQEYKWNLEDV